MYAQNQPLNPPTLCPVGAGNDGLVENLATDYEVQSLKDSGVGGLGTEEVSIQTDDGIYTVGGGEGSNVYVPCAAYGNDQVALSFRDRVFVFDGVTADKVKIF